MEKSACQLVRARAEVVTEVTVVAVVPFACSPAAGVRCCVTAFLFALKLTPIFMLPHENSN